MSDKNIKITDIVDFNPKRLVKKGSVAPFVDMAALPVDNRNISAIREREFKGSGSKFINGDTLFARITPCLENGKTAKVSGLPDGIAACGSTEFIVMAAKDPKYDEDYVYYLARLPQFRLYAQARMEGTSGRQRVPWQSLAEFNYYFPKKEKRKEIGKFFKSIDDKIELNRQTNQTLENIAQAIFKSWFVDFEPTRAKIAAKQNGQDPERAAMAAISGKTLEELNQLKPEQQQSLKSIAALFPDTLMDSELGQIPEDWGAKPLGDYLEIKRGGSPRPIKEYIVEKGFPWTKIADATSEPSPFLFKTKECIKGEGLKKTVLLKKGTLILSNSATPGLPKFLELDACIHDGWLHFPEKKLFSNVYLYQLFLVIRKALVAQGNGSVFTNLKTDILRNQVVVVPLPQIIEQFDNTVALIFKKLKENCKEINTLVELRNSLLPKLISGELNINKAV